MKVCKSDCKLELKDEDFPWKNKAKEIRREECKLCFNAHNRASYARNSSFRRVNIRKLKKEKRAALQEYVLDYLTKNPCVDCGESDILTLDFDHRDRSTKEINVSDALTKNSWSLMRFKKEIAKCDVRCANCHRKKTHKENNSYRYKKSIE